MHGGFAFDAVDFEDARPFLDAGFALMCPTHRGENGNPGHFEMFLGEVADARAAIAWLAAQEGVDASRLYAFGHSAGGAISALLSLHDVPIRHSGSSGGLLGPGFFQTFSDIVPFDLGDRREVEVRLLVGNQRWMRKPHHAFVGDANVGEGVALAKQEPPSGSAPLKIVELPGDHFSSLAPAVKAYIDIIKAHP